MSGEDDQHVTVVLRVRLQLHRGMIGELRGVAVAWIGGREERGVKGEIVEVVSRSGSSGEFFEGSDATAVGVACGRGILIPINKIEEEVVVA